MGIPIRALIVEDLADDAELILRLLRRAGYDPAWQRAQTAEDIKTALERETWDVVVSDYSMPQFDARAALNLLRQTGQDVPFIVVSGSIGEDVAVAMMKAGASDYVLKQNLARFIPALQRELREAESRRQQREAVRRSEQRFKAVFDTAGECIKILGPNQELLEMNAAGLAMLEVGSLDEMRSLSLVDFILPEHHAAFGDLHRRAMGGESGVLQFEVTGLRGTRRWLESHATPMRDADGRVTMVLKITNDITQRKQDEEALHNSLREKSALLKEVHHRVKNNLQIINSLLRLETGRSAHPDTKSVLKEMQGRIQAMALLHETLYRSGTFASPDLGAYLTQLATQSFRALNARPGSIRLDLDLASVRVEMDQAIPCGLLVNELISNCLKHGFPGGRSGDIRVELQPVGGGLLRLSVSDTGVGLPEDFESKRGQSLGLQLVSDLARQIGGRLEIGPGPGTGAVFAVTFPGGEPNESESGGGRAGMDTIEIQSAIPE